MKKIAIFLIALSCSGLAQAKEGDNSEGINFYAPDYPARLKLTAKTGCSYQPLVCKQSGSYIVNCSFDVSSSIICTENTTGYVYFQKKIGSEYCMYNLSLSRQKGGNYTLSVYTSEEHGIKCDRYPSGGVYRISY